MSLTAHADPHRVGFGDDVAMSAGLVRWSASGVPRPCGDALGDPLTGVHAAVAAAAGLWAGGRHRIELSLHEVARSLVGPVPDAPVRWDQDRWLVEAEPGWVPVRPPQARPAGGRARPSGADNETILVRLDSAAGVVAVPALRRSSSPG